MGVQKDAKKAVEYYQYKNFLFFKNNFYYNIRRVTKNKQHRAQIQFQITLKIDCQHTIMIIPKQFKNRYQLKKSEIYHINLIFCKVTFQIFYFDVYKLILCYNLTIKIYRPTNINVNMKVNIIILMK